MNTPAHLIVNLAVLGTGRGRPYTGAIVAGSVLPDAPMFVFFLWERFVEQRPMRLIWDEAYFRPDWQAFFDAFNSIPLAACALGIALVARRPAQAWLFASMILHASIDLLVHREDGHRHFFPLSDWRFMSPVSYWDPAYHGAWGAGLECAVQLGASAVLWRRFDSRLVRGLLVGLNALAVSGYVTFYFLRPAS